MHLNTVKTHVVFWAWQTFSFNFIFNLTYLRSFVSYVVRLSCYYTLVRPSLATAVATDRISRLSWPNVSFAANHRWSCRSIIDTAIDLFTSEDRYFLWIAAVPLFTIPTTFGNAHARCYTREAPLTQSATQVGSSLLDSSMLWLFREAITYPIIVFTSIPTCFAGTKSIAIDLITVKDRFFLSIGRQRQSAISSCCDQVIAEWL